jgi:hypothetical protein
MITKECGTCTKCCEGWLTASINGHDMFPGKPCFFLEIGNRCTIYQDRPKDPCKDFLCGWLQIEDMPKEFKPDKSGVIMNYIKNNNNPYWYLWKSPNNPTEDLLSWAISYAKKKNENILWFIDDRSFWIGNKEFCDQMEIEYSVSYFSIVSIDKGVMNV